MTTSLLAETPAELLGAQRPSVCHVPAFESSSGAEAVELAASAGLHLDDWQKYVLHVMLGERADGSWAAFQFGLAVSRQNGKGAIYEARELAGLFLLGERFLTHSAHQFDTSLEAFRRLLELIENSDDLRREVKRVSRSHGEEGIELLSGQRIRFRTRTKGGGRGFTGDFLGLDEAMELAGGAHGALLPTLSARPNPQVLYAGSSVDQTIHEHGRVFAGLRARGHAGTDQRLAWMEWTADPSLEQSPDRSADLATDAEAWARANPGLGIRITTDYVETEQRALDARTFAVERLGIGDWPKLDLEDGAVISVKAWKALHDETSAPLDPVTFAYDIPPDRGSAAIAVAGRRSDGLRHVEVIEHRLGTRWLPERLAELTSAHRCGPVRYDPSSPAASIITALEDLRVEADPVTANEHAQACGVIFDAVDHATVRHRGPHDVTDALKGAGKRPLGEAWGWSRKASSVDISPLVAVTLALWGSDSYREKVRVKPRLEVWA